MGDVDITRAGTPCNVIKIYYKRNLLQACSILHDTRPGHLVGVVFWRNGFVNLKPDLHPRCRCGPQTRARMRTHPHIAGWRPPDAGGVRPFLGAATGEGPPRWMIPEAINLWTLLMAGRAGFGWVQRVNGHCC